VTGPTPADSQGSWVQVWLEAGREGQVFTYSNPKQLPCARGDLVQIRLRGRRHIGLVLELLDERPAALAGKALQPIETVHQQAAVEPDWQSLIETVAQQCRTTSFRTLKAVLPPGWLGQRPAAAAQRPREQLWLELIQPPTETERSRWSDAQSRLLQVLEAHGGQCWQTQALEAAQVSRSVSDTLQRRGILRRERRPFQAEEVMRPGGDGSPPKQLTEDQA